MKTATQEDIKRIKNKAEKDVDFLMNVKGFDLILKNKKEEYWLFSYSWHGKIYNEYIHGDFYEYFINFVEQDPAGRYVNHLPLSREQYRKLSIIQTIRMQMDVEELKINF